MSPKKKLIEVSIPLEAINEASAKEKSIRANHPSTLHLWWARRPLATARAVLWASLIDDPGNDTDRSRLHEILARLVQWDSDNVVNPQALRDALAELPDNASLPELLDPFAGGGSIPLEGQRLGLHVHAHDLNPTAVLLNKAMIELPAKFCSLPPVNPEARSLVGWENSGDAAHGLAQDIRYYGNRLRELAFARLGSMYPDCRGRQVIAWLWARTVKCPNPACGLDMPLVSSWELSAKQKAHSVPHYSVDGKLSFTVGQGKVPTSPKIGRGKFACSACGQAVSNEYLHTEFCAHRDGVRMIGVVCEGEKGRVYVSPDEEQERAAEVDRPESYPNEEMNPNTPDLISGRGYGFTHWHELFTNRQLTMLTTLAEIIPQIVDSVERDAEACGDRASREYAEAVGVYLAFVLDKVLQYHSSICLWDSTRDGVAQTFARQAIPMVWDFVEANPFSNSSGSFKNMLGWIVDVVETLPAAPKGEASQHDAQQASSLRNVMISTDPPYYDNIGYADLSDYFYIWLRQTLRRTYPDLFRRMLVPKDDELVAAPHRHKGSKAKAREFFETGMLAALKNLYDCASDDYPTTIYYAYKSGDKDGANTGWETMLSAVINAGFQITGTWPMRTELTTALKATTASLASSVVLVCRKRSPDAGSCGLSEFRRELRAELGPALSTLRAGNIAAVDLPQSAIGPGMAVYSRYREVSSSDGQALTIRAALQEINAAVDEILGSAETMDSMSRFCADVYALSGWNAIESGDAINLATGRGISLDALVNAKLVTKKQGKVALVARERLKAGDGANEWSLAQALSLARETGGAVKNGIEACGRMIHVSGLANAERAKNLAYLLYKIANDKRWTSEARLYNQLVMSWGEILKAEAAITGEMLPDPQINFEREMED